MTQTACHFFALGARRTGDPKWDAQELTRILDNGWHASKNACNVLLVAVGWETGENIDVGGEHPCIQKTKDGGIVHHRRAKLWVCHTDSRLIHGIAFCSTATDPEGPFYGPFLLFLLWFLLFFWNRKKGQDHVPAQRCMKFILMQTIFTAVLRFLQKNMALQFFPISVCFTLA